MKRLIPLVIAGVGVTVISLGFVGVAVIYYMTLQTPVTPPPFTYTDLEDLQTRPDKAAAQIPRIIACFEVEDEDLRFQATETLKALGVKAVDPLRTKLKDKNAKVRFYAVQTLAMIGPD